MRIKKNTLMNLIAGISPSLFFSISYVHNRRRLRYRRKDLSALWIKKVLSGEINKIYYLADKYRVRNYIKEKGLNTILPNLIGAYDKPEQIPYDKLPDRFAIKMNYGAGMNIICTDKSTLDIDATNQRLNQWLKGSKYSLAERHYNLIERKIIIEEFIEDGNGGFPVDYKFLCLNGKVVCCLYCSGRESGHADYLPYDLDWKPKLSWIKNPLPLDYVFAKCPDNFSSMVSVAERLAEGVDMIRVDLYSDGYNIWFGELTLTPAGCIFHRWSNEAMDELGKKFLKSIQ